LRKLTLLIREHPAPPPPPLPTKLLTTISTALAPKGAIDLKNCSRAVENFAKDLLQQCVSLCASIINEQTV
jgi:hypothetical protein